MMKHILNVHKCPQQKFPIDSSLKHNHFIFVLYTVHYGFKCLDNLHFRSADLHAPFLRGLVHDLLHAGVDEALLALDVVQLPRGEEVEEDGVTERAERMVQVLDARRGQHHVGDAVVDRGARRDRSPIVGYEL